MATDVKTLGSYELDERAAILEFEAGYSREEAENIALESNIVLN